MSFTWTAWSRSSKEVIPTKSGFADRRSGLGFIHEMTTSDQGSENDIRADLDHRIQEDGVQGKDKPHTVESKARNLFED